MSDFMSPPPLWSRRRNERVRALFPGLLIAMTLSLSACADKPSRQMGGPPIEGYNHTSAAINRFSVNGNGGPNVGPHQGGGKQNCCVSLPVKWQPGLQVVVEWEKDPDPFAQARWPERMFTEEWTKRMRESRSEYTRHRAVVDVAPYEDLGVVDVHFLPCDQVKVAAGIYGPRHAKHPFKFPANMEETTTCPTL